MSCFSVEIPVVQDVAHGDDVCLREGIGEEVAGGDGDPLAEPGRGDRPRRDRCHDRQVIGCAAQMGVTTGEGLTELARRAARVADRVIASEVEPLG